MNGPGGLAGRSALVTGGACDIGAEIARRLAAEGAAVALGHYDDGAEARALADVIRAEGGRAAAIRADLTSPDGAATLVEAAAAELGGLDIVVNNAAATYWRPLEKTPLEDIDHILCLDARAPYLVMQAAAGRLGAGGRIINISSDLTARALPGSSLYAAAMAFVEQTTRVAAREFADRKVTVNAVAHGVDRPVPRPPDTGEPPAPVAGWDAAGGDDPAGVAALVAFLASGDADAITGQVVHVSSSPT